MAEAEAVHPSGTEGSDTQGETMTFQAEVSRLLDIVVHSLYSQKEIFLRELISNASDACDKLRYQALTDPSLTQDEGQDFAIRVSFDRDNRSVTIADNGIGMNRDDLVRELGTIASSGTANFLSNLTGDQKKDAQLIGQFGVGFYSAFMVAREVVVETRKAGESTGWIWRSDGRGSFTVAQADALPRGTRVTLYLAEGEDEFLDENRLKTIIQTYSDHIAIPIRMAEATTDEEGNETGVEDATVNRASALWTRPKSEISEDDYKEFYHHVAHGADDPWLTIHWKAEGMIEYTALLFVPSTRPFDLFNPERQNRVKLYVRRVFITDNAPDLLPSWLRFLRGIVDSEDLPLNVSREMLQSHPMVAKIRQGLVKRVLQELEKKAEADPDGYNSFWDNFGAVLKEGIYEDFEKRDQLMKLARFRTTKSPDKPISLADYVSRMKENQTNIYYITGDDTAQALKSPQLEGYRAKDVEVLILTDPVDEFWVGSADYEGKGFRSVTRGGDDLDQIPSADEESGEDKSSESETSSDSVKTDRLIAVFKEALGDSVKDVRASKRLRDSAVCLVADEQGLDMHLERLLRQHQQIDTLAQRILEINPKHPLIQQLAGSVEDTSRREQIEDIAQVLLDQARIIEGEGVRDPAEFSRRLSSWLQSGFSHAA